MNPSRHRKYKIFGLIAALLGVAFLFQNMTTLDFTKKTRASNTPTSLERAIQRADSDQERRQKKMGLDDRGIQKKYMQKKRNPDAIVGDINVDEAEMAKRKRQKKKSIKQGQ